MDFTISPRVQSVVEQIRAFVDEDIVPLEPEFLNGELRDMLPVMQKKRELVKAAGLWAPHLPEAHGGLGLSLAEFGHVSETLGRSPLGHYAFNCQAPDVGNMEILMHYGTEEQKRSFLGPLTRGEVRSSRPTSSNDPAPSAGPAAAKAARGRQAVDRQDSAGADGAPTATAAADTSTRSPPSSQAID